MKDTIASVIMVSMILLWSKIATRTILFGYLCQSLSSSGSQIKFKECKLELALNTEARLLNTLIGLMSTQLSMIQEPVWSMLLQDLDMN